MSVDKSKVLIQVQDLKKAFGSNQVLDGISTDICQGEVVAIIGPSGSGKSTFLRSLNLLEEPTGGKILFEGTDITDPKVDINRHRQKIGMVFQQFNLFPHKTVKHIRISICFIWKSHTGKKLVRTSGSLFLCHQFQGNRCHHNILLYRLVWKQIKLLENHSDLLTMSIFV